MSKNTPRLVLVWDPATRLFHWAIVVLMAVTYLTWRWDRMLWHAWSGDAVLALILFRLAWGFIGSDSARFAHFLARPAAFLRYISHILVRTADREAGHNPAGGWMVVLLLLLMLGQALTGIYINNEVAVDGPLGDAVPVPIMNLLTDLHSVLWDALLAAMALHVLAIAGYALVKGQDLLLPMLTGRKMLPSDVAAPRTAGAVRALAVLLAAVAVTAAVANYL